MDNNPHGPHTEYLWALKSSIIQSAEAEEFRKRRTTPSITVKRRGETNEDNYVERHVRIMASLVPDEIIYNIGDYSMKDLDACLLFGDVSGFTDLCEKYNTTGKGGPSRLTQVLNSYIGAMVQEILSHSGDVLKFSGDAFIAMWKETEHLSLRDAVHEALDCALVIQKTYGTYLTDVDVVVRVKLAVSCGHLLFSIVGDENNSHYLTVGQPIDDIKAAESKSSAGEIVISARVIHHITANEYLIDLLPDGIHARVLGVGPNWRNIQRHYEKTDFVEIYSLLSDLPEDLTDDVDRITNISEDRSSIGQEEPTQALNASTDQYALRPAVNLAVRLNILNELRRFIIAPVMNGIDAEEPIEYMTEIRQVCILFINIKVNENISSTQGTEVANKVYILVCNTVKNGNGCVNKISNFDKDLMLLVIFGLRGFKHELESQLALKCAIECHNKLTALDDIMGVAAGVTTGKCYCGAFGHTLRREYTVIGLVVNKAARLMVAYPGKVTCDRETFLHSKLESKNFILQEYKFLKGIVNPGAIYEFQGIQIIQVDTPLEDPSPLLGRDQEIYLYNSLLHKAKKYWEDKRAYSSVISVLVFEGAFRVGKTRLLEEIMFITKVPVQKFILSAFVVDVVEPVPYKTIQVLFNRFLNIADDETPEQKEEKIKSHITDPALQRYLCVLNVVFDVTFFHTVEYEILTEKNKYQQLQAVFKELCQKIFQTFQVLIIDNSQCIDDESWLLLEVLIDINTVFTVVTLETETTISPGALKIFENPKVKVVTLKAIEKWYHVGLACQMLKVDGIPPELEKTIQLKSSGNPGWIESFLVSLMQSGGLSIKKISRIQAYNHGIVIAPLYMTKRLTRAEKARWVEIMEEKELGGKDDKMTTRWKMFLDSCRESFPDLTAVTDKIKQEDKIRIGIVRKTFNLEDVDPELAIDVIILKTFDALTSYEQLLLKCSAVLGDTFPMDMLLYIMSSSAIRTTALAVMKLFEIQVLSCAKGDFIEGGLNFEERLKDPNADMDVQCGCKGLIIDEACRDLPKYASCGYLRFRSSEFRETTYNLLTDNQKREFHERAIRYLEKETRSCRACGNRFFNRQIGGTRIDHTLRIISKKEKKFLMSETPSIIDSFGVAKILQSSSFTTLESLASGKSKDFGRYKDAISLYSSFSSGRDITSLESQIFGIKINETGLSLVRRWKDNFYLMRTFSTTNYSQCTCHLILCSMYSQLIYHCKGSGMAEKNLSATVEYAYVCIENENIAQAIKVLEEALKLLEGPMKDQFELDWMVDLKKGKLFALLGYARMQVNDDDAYNYFLEALRLYSVRFPKTPTTKKIYSTVFKLKQTVKYYLGRTTASKKVDEDYAEYNNDVSECLGFLCKYFLSKGRWHEAEMAAMWSLARALRSESDFEKVCNAYSNLIYCQSTLGQYKFSIYLEVFALSFCHRKKTLVEADELKALARLYYAIFRDRIRRAEIAKCLHIGYVGLRLANSSRMHNLVFRTVPLLAIIVLYRRQIPEFVNMLDEVKNLISRDNDNSQKAWYYNLCLMVHIETGLTAEPISNILNYIQEEGWETQLRDPDGKKQLMVLLWLWELRKENWESAVGWQRTAFNFNIRKLEENTVNLKTMLYLLEALIIYLAYKMDRKHISAVDKANKRINEVLDTLEKFHRFKIILPRLYHMKGYYRIVKYNDYKGAMKQLRIGKKHADINSNEIDAGFIKHSEMVYFA
uniref:Adenylate cyclase type 10-like n=1 Tax=Diabrotica virgifera virgifera TaxID=50390 RepID=A0A6P7FT00_DIAVI